MKNTIKQIKPFQTFSHTCINNVEHINTSKGKTIIIDRNRRTTKIITRRKYSSTTISVDHNKRNNALRMLAAVDKLVDIMADHISHPDPMKEREIKPNVVAVDYYEGVPVYRTKLLKHERKN